MRSNGKIILVLGKNQLSWLNQHQTISLTIMLFVLALIQTILPNRMLLLAIVMKMEIVWPLLMFWDIWFNYVVRSLSSTNGKKLTTFAKKSGKTKAACVREAIIEYFENMEDIFVATHRLKRPSKKYSFEELKRELGIWVWWSCCKGFQEDWVLSSVWNYQIHCWAPHHGWRSKKIWEAINRQPSRSLALPSQQL